MSTFKGEPDIGGPGDDDDALKRMCNMSGCIIAGLTVDNRGRIQKQDGMIALATLFLFVYASFVWTSGYKANDPTAHGPLERPITIVWTFEDIIGCFEVTQNLNLRSSIGQ